MALRLRGPAYVDGDRLGGRRWRGRRDRRGHHVLTGATSSADALPFPSTTLDSLLAGTDGARLLVKLDVEGHELEVLEGASALLERTEVIVAEFAMFRLFDQPMTILPDLIASLDASGFALYDVASLRGRAGATGRLVSGDAVFVRRGSTLLADVAV